MEFRYRATKKTEAPFPFTAGEGAVLSIVMEESPKTNRYQQGMASIETGTDRIADLPSYLGAWGA